MQHLSYEAQLSAKTKSAADLLRRSSSTAGICVEKALKSPLLTRYRNKAQVPLRSDNGAVRAGFFHPGTRDIVDFTDCLVQPELSVKVINAVKKTACVQKWQIYDRTARKGWLKHIFVRTTRGGKAMAALTAGYEPPIDMLKAARQLSVEIPEITSVYLNIQPRDTSVVLGPRWIKIDGTSLLEETICGLRFMFYPGSFLQVNTPAAEILYGIIHEFLASGQRTGGLYDLYCGIGTISLIEAKHFRAVTGIEENKGAAACAWKNAQKNKIRNVRFMSGDAEEIFAARIERAPSVPVSVVVDPPRQGCGRGLLEKFKHPGIRKIIYASCNTETFARDAGILRSSGFALKKIQPVDMFPHTSHIELAALFERN